MSELRIQPPRVAKKQPGTLVPYDPVEDASEETQQATIDTRVERFGDAFADAIYWWTSNSSSDIRRFFWEGRWDFGKMTVFLMSEGYEDEDAKDLQYQFDVLRAFWEAMNSDKLRRMPRSIILYRGIDFEPQMLRGPGYVMENVISNWSASPKVSQRFAGSTCCLLQAKFPAGTKFYYTGPNGLNEFEFIIPGGQFRQILPKRAVPVLKYPTRQMTMYPLEYIPRGDQRFPWPDASPSPATRANYQQLLKDQPTKPVAVATTAAKPTTVQIPTAPQLPLFPAPSLSTLLSLPLIPAIPSMSLKSKPAAVSMPMPISPTPSSPNVSMSPIPSSPIIPMSPLSPLGTISAAANPTLNFGFYPPPSKKSGGRRRAVVRGRPPFCSPPFGRYTIRF